MKMKRTLVAAAAAILLAGGALPAYAKPQPIPHKDLMKRMEAELSTLKAEIDEQLVNNPSAQKTASDYINGTLKEFRVRVESLGREPNYDIEAKYVREAFEALILKKVREMADLANNKRMKAADMQMAFAQIGHRDDERRENFERAFMRDHAKEIREVVALRKNQPDSDDAHAQGGGDSLEGDVHAQPDGAFAGYLMPVFKRESPLIQAGIGSVKVGVEGATPSPPNPPGGGTGGSGPNGGTGTGSGSGSGSGSNPGGLAPGGQVPGGGSSPNGGLDWGDIMNNVNTGGAPQVVSGAAGDALLAGRYSEAASLARTALQMDPGNRDAKGVLYSVQGRSDGADASAAGLSTARAGAAAFATGSPGAGVAGGANASLGFAGGVSAGAARLITEQAQNGAKNAMKLGDAQGALDILNKALSQNSENPALLNLRAQVYGRLGRWEDALKDAAAGLALAPGNMALLNTQALAQNRTHRYREALATANLMIAADPSNAWGYANRAHAWGGLGDKAAMMADIGQAAKLDPGFQRSADAAALLQLPSEADVLFLFPGESGKGAAPAAAPAAAGRGRSFGVVVGAGIFGGLLLALGLLSTVLAPLKNTVVSVFTKAKRTGPATTQAVATAQPASVAGNVGGLIRGQYEISRQIGQGGMGTVYEGTDRSLGRRVAIKKMREELRVNARERDRFIIEAKTVASLHHPNIVDIYAIAEEGEDVYLVFEYVDGKTVHDLVQAKGRLDPAESVRVTRAMGEALTYAHAHGVIHRDMKPSNVMVTGAGHIKVMDFGIARMAKDAMTRYSMTNTVVGTPPYMAPEQEQGVVRKESDVYSLAICSYEMLTGKMPFIGIGAGMLMNKINMSYIPPSRAIAGLPEPLDEVFVKAFQADPDRRYRTPQEFVAALAAAADGYRSKTA